MRLNRTWLVFLIAGALFATTTLINGARKYQSDVEVVGNLVIDGTTTLNGCTGCTSGAVAISGSPAAGYVPYWTNGTTQAGANISGAVKAGNPPTQAACADLSNAVATCSSLNAANLTGTLGNGQYYGTLGSSYVATSESTSSTTFVQLTTHDTVTFVLAATTNVIATYMAYESPTLGTPACVTQFNVDTVDATATALFATGLGTAASAPITNEYKVSLAAGSHTIFVDYKVTSNGCNFFNRLLRIEAAP